MSGNDSFLLIKIAFQCRGKGKKNTLRDFWHEGSQIVFLNSVKIDRS